jgi:hypothetical protein
MLLAYLEGPVDQPLIEELLEHPPADHSIFRSCRGSIGIKRPISTDNDATLINACMRISIEGECGLAVYMYINK